MKDNSSLLAKITRKMYQKVWLVVNFWENCMRYRRDTRETDSSYAYDGIMMPSVPAKFRTFIYICLDAAAMNWRARSVSRGWMHRWLLETRGYGAQALERLCFQFFFPFFSYPSVPNALSRYSP